MDWLTFKSQQERGSILELQVEKIIYTHQFVIFEHDGISFRLHIRNLSNNPKLSEKLFDTIQIGETIRSVIIDFNDEKKYVELSLKPLRNNLDGHLSFTKCRNTIEDRKAMRINLPADILEENRNQLNRIQGDLAKVDLTFLYELIQNAIDHPNPQFDNKLLIKFEVFNDYLLLKHNGSIFTEDNFRSLTGILLGEEEASQERIGYKGIGFKSIFRYTQEVYVRSGNFSFSFSKIRTGAKLPWEVVPIFENEIDKVDEIRNFEFFNTPVAFAFKFTNPKLREQAIDYLEQLITTPETLLFLDRLSELEVVLDGQTKRITRSVEDRDTYKKVLLQLNNDIPIEWLVCSEKQTITNETILNELKDENNPSIPLKFRYFNTPQIQIALPLAPRANLINMYAHLPLSETKYGLPYIINGDFIPNLDRTDLIKNLQYNYYLSSLTAQAVIKLINVVSKERSLNLALELTVSLSKTTADFFRRMYVSLMEIKSQIRVTHINEKEYSLNQLVFDESGIFKIIPASKLSALAGFADSLLLNIDNQDIIGKLIKNHQVKKFTFDNAITLLNQGSTREIYLEGIEKLSIFLFRLSRIDEADQWKKMFSKVIIKIQDEHECYLNQYFLISDLRYLSAFGKFLKAKPLDKKWAIVLNKHPNIKEIFVEFGLKKITLRQILDAFLKHNISLESITLESNEYLNLIWAYLFSVKDITNSDGGKMVNERFKTFPITTTSGAANTLENTFVGNVNSAGISYSFLHENFGAKNLIRADLAKIAIIAGVESKDILNFLQTIHEDIEITENKLFKTSLRNLLKMDSEELMILNPKILEKALVSVFHYAKENPKDDLIKMGMLEFPVFCTDQSIDKLCFTYFDQSYAFAFTSEALFADKMFEESEDIKFISYNYLEHLKVTEKLEFVVFLQKFFVSPGIKIIPGQLLKNQNRINITNYDSSYQGYNRGFTNFLSQSEFLIVKDVAKLSGIYNGLILFWTHLNKIKQFDLLTNSISCNNYQNINPFIWLLNLSRYQLYPMKDGSVRFVDEVYSKKMSDFLLKDGAKPHPCLDTLNPKLAESLNFSNSLNTKEIIDGLRLVKNLPEELITKLMLDFFAKATFTDEELNLIKEESYFLAKDQSLQHISKFAYFKRDLEETSLALAQDGLPLSQQLYTFDFHDSFKNQIELLGIPIKSKSDITVLTAEVMEDNETSEMESIINEFVENESLGKVVNFAESNFIKCRKLNVGLIDLEIYSSEVDSFYDSLNNSYYFLTIRDLADLVCEENQWGHTVNRKLRKVLDGAFSKNPKRVDSKQKPVVQDKYSTDELEQIKRLFSRDLEESELMEENLYAQIKALRYFQDKSYNTKKAELNFDKTYRDKYLDPIIDLTGREIKVLCRSARRGVLFMGGYGWMNLTNENTILYVLTGDTSTDCILINSTEELESQFKSFFKVLRRTNTEHLDVKNLIENDHNASELQLLYKVKDSDFDIIFNPQQNEPGETEGALIDDDI